MTGMEIVKMSAKGQLVVPESIRAAEGFEPGDRFIPVATEEGVMFKKVELDRLRKEFERVSKSMRETMRKNKITKKDIEEAIKWARSGS